MNSILKHELKMSLAVAGLQIGLPQNWVFRRLHLDTTRQWVAMQRSGVTNKLRRKIFWRHHGICYLCGRYIPFADFHLEHKLALSNGGDNRESNLGASHSRCNLRKGSKRL